MVDRPRSAQVVERGGRPVWRHVQHGAELPVPKDPYATAVGLDSGVTHTLTSSQGEHLDRPDTSALLVEAGRLAGPARRCGTRQDRSASADVLVIENLAVPNLTASARRRAPFPANAPSAD